MYEDFGDIRDFRDIKKGLKFNSLQRISLKSRGFKWKLAKSHL